MDKFIDAEEVRRAMIDTPAISWTDREIDEWIEELSDSGIGFQLMIATGNAAMNSHEDIAVALEHVAAVVRLRAESPDSGMVMDVNGNKVGEWYLAVELGEF